MTHKNITTMLIVLIVLVMIGLCILLAAPAAAYEGEPIRTERQEMLHAAADILREYGFQDYSPAVRALSAAWYAEQEKLDIVAKVIQNEADPQWCEWEHSVAVGAVVMNRVASDLFPDTVKEVVAAPGQYLRSYTYGFDETSRLAYLAAKDAIDGNHNVPADAYWQDTTIQGAEIWKTFELDTGWFRSTTYICRGVA